MNEHPKILICGGRDFNDRQLLATTLYRIVSSKWEWPKQVVLVIEGGAKGADRLGREWALDNWCPFITYPADWGTYGKRAGPIRNQKMIDEEHPDIVIAFPTKTSRGTWDMVRRAKRHGIETIIVGDNEPISKNSK